MLCFENPNNSKKKTKKNNYTQISPNFGKKIPRNLDSYQKTQI